MAEKTGNRIVQVGIISSSLEDEPRTRVIVRVYEDPTSGKGYTTLQDAILLDDGKNVIYALDGPEVKADDS
jgi:hypothetical protein